MCKFTQFTYIYMVGQNRIYTPYMTVFFGICLPKITYIHRIYMVLGNPMYMCVYIRLYPDDLI